MGIALSDPLGITAQPLEIVERKSLSRDIDRLRTIVEQFQVDTLVLGMPREMNGSPGKLSEEIAAFRAELESGLGLRVIEWDERLTTAEAERLLLAADVSRRRRRQVTDKIAAALILQSYLDSIRKKQV